MTVITDPKAAEIIAAAAQLSAQDIELTYSAHELAWVPAVGDSCFINGDKYKVVEMSEFNRVGAGGIATTYRVRCRPLG